MTNKLKNISASVRAKLLNIAKKSKKDYNAVIRLYFQERFLYRLSISPYKSQLILKGALLLMMKDISKFRPTRDIDFLGKGFSNKVDDCEEIIKEIASIKNNDGVEFLVDSIAAKILKEGADYEGVRIHLPCKIDTIKSYLSIDLGFGDKIVNGPYDIDFPTLLDFPSPQILVYSLESAVAEKFEAIVKLNFTTSRMKDFFDLIFIAENSSFEINTIRKAIFTTFIERETNIEDRNIIFNTKFQNDPHKQVQWRAFLNRNKLATKNNFTLVVEKIESFIKPILTDNQNQIWNSKEWKWE